VTLTTRKYFYTSFSFGTWLSNLHVCVNAKEWITFLFSERRYWIWRFQSLPNQISQLVRNARIQAL